MPWDSNHYCYPEYLMPQTYFSLDAPFFSFWKLLFTAQEVQAIQLELPEDLQ